MIWFTSDPHYGHKNIINFCRRPFSDVDNQTALLIMNWNEVVAPEDTVYVLGDFAFKLPENLKVVNRLNGKKILVAGNHDKCWINRSSRDLWRAKYIEAGFVAVLDRVDMYLNDWDLSLTISHFPFKGDSHYKDTDPYWDVRPVDDGQWLIHGHVHDMWQQRGRMINVGVDVWNYYPVSFDTILDLIEDGENDLKIKPKGSPNDFAG